MKKLSVLFFVLSFLLGGIAISQAADATTNAAISSPVSKNTSSSETGKSKTHTKKTKKTKKTKTTKTTGTKKKKKKTTGANTATVPAKS